MKKHISHLIYGCLALMGLLSSCGEDRSGEYYALIATKTWIYEAMQENYLFYEDIPAEEKLDFFKKPADFLASAASSKDQKGGYVFSHVDSVLTTSRATSTYPCFGFEAALVRELNALRVLYVQPNSPAKEAGLKRGDWIIAIDSQKISISNYSTYITHPTKAHRFTLGKYNPYPENVDDPEFNYVEFDTLGVVQMPEPRYVEEQDVLKYGIISSGNRKAFYLLYNEFGEDTKALKEVLSQLGGQQFDDFILDLRYNPGGYVNTAHELGSALAPATAMGQPFLHMIYNDKINKTETLNLEASPLTGGVNLSYENLYVLTSENTASASEMMINNLSPHMEVNLIGTQTEGKNVAMTRIDSPYNFVIYPVTSTVYNSEGKSDYADGFTPAYTIDELEYYPWYDLGDERELLLYNTLQWIAGGTPPDAENQPSADTSSTRQGRFTRSVVPGYSSIRQKTFPAAILTD